MLPWTQLYLDIIALQLCKAEFLYKDKSKWPWRLQFGLSWIFFFSLQIKSQYGFIFKLNGLNLNLHFKSLNHILLIFWRKHFNFGNNSMSSLHLWTHLLRVLMKTIQKKSPVNYGYINHHFPIGATLGDNKKCFHKNMTYYFNTEWINLFWKLVL